MTRPAWIWPFRITMTVAALLMCVQPVLAGQFMSGTHGALRAHDRNADLAAAGVLVSVVCAVLLRWLGRGPLWPSLVSALLLVMTGAEIGLGKQRVLAVHVPLAVAIVMLAVWLAVWSWRRHVKVPAEVNA